MAVGGNMSLRPKEAIIIYLRRSETCPARYMAGIRKADTSFQPTHNDLQIGSFQEPIFELGEFGNLDEAINAASKKLQRCGR
jgi:hypothetical protein